MAYYWVDFSGYVKVKADSPEGAEQKMWDLINDQYQVDGDYSDDVWDIDGVEPCSEEDDC